MCFPSQPIFLCCVETIKTLQRVGILLDELERLIISEAAKRHILAIMQQDSSTELDGTHVQKPRDFD
jgi:hypothetical protein